MQAGRAQHSKCGASRLETEMAAVDREELVQGKALAEANADMDRQARLLAEQELERLGGCMEVPVLC
jgi:hypothetical protein